MDEMENELEHELVDDRLPYMGAFFDRDQVIEFLNFSLNEGYADLARTDSGNYFVAETPDGMQLWYQQAPEDEEGVTDFAVHYKTPTRVKVVLDGWTEQSENGLVGLAHVWNLNGDTDFPMNLDVVNAGMFADYDAGEFTAQIAAYGRNITLYADVDAFRSADTKFAPESCIPMGTFPLDDDDPDWSPSANIILTGRIERVYNCKNAYTDHPYQHLLVSCLGLKLDVLLDKDSIKGKPVVGGIVQGIFYLTARLFHSDNDKCLTPLFAIDTNRIIESWTDLTLDEEYTEPTSGWRLLTYPIMPDKTLLLIFENSVEDEEHQPENTTYFYRFLHYDAEGKIIEKRRMRQVGEVVNTAYYDNAGHLHVIFTPVGKDCEYVFDTDDGLEEHPAHSIGGDVERAITDSRGNIFVGRDFSGYLEWSGELISVYGPDREKKLHSTGNGYCCAEVYLDKNETVWCYTEPVTMLRKLTPLEDGSGFCPTQETFPLSGVIGMAISADGSQMFCECRGIPNRSRFYILKRGEHCFEAPKQVCLPLVQFFESCNTYGMCSTTKDRILFNVDGVLYLYRLENARCDTLDDLPRQKLKQRNEENGHYYSLNIDPDAPVDIAALDFNVKPILEDMQGRSWEHLTIGYSRPRIKDMIKFIQVVRDGDNYHLEIGTDEPRDDYPVKIYLLDKADFDTTYAVFKMVLVDRECPDLSQWQDYTETVFKSRPLPL